MRAAEPWPPAEWTDWPEQEPGGTVVGSGRPPGAARGPGSHPEEARRSAGPERSAARSGESAADRLAAARGLLRRMEERTAGTERPAPAPGEDGRVLPVAAALSPLLPAGGLRRGSTVAVAGGPGSLSLLFALLAEASAEGAWAGVVGVPGLGAVAAAEAGVRLERLALVPQPGADLVAVASALLDGLDLVVLAGARGVRAGDRQRLAARARQRGSVLLALGPWPGADLTLGCRDVRWRGTDRGAGRLRARRAVVHCGGRGTGVAGREAELLLPGARGVAEVGHVADPGAADPGWPGAGSGAEEPAAAAAVS
ncbi:hypothetical protein [Pseudonocardia oroxyli]|uniref:Protein RecA n=1 Tax=Pseudonocardia oroxyli TaxID=366584 RepID=A0A1G7GSW7_PSEOR|nr:hypothetical protein SAMN05216377_102448 [Pseudonocardia oroxyli]